MKKKLLIISVPVLGVLMTIGGTALHDLYPRLSDTGITTALVGLLMSIYGGMAAVVTLMEDAK